MMSPDLRYSLPEDDLARVCKRVALHWECFRNQRVFLTGGSGFFGHWLLETFLWANETLQLNATLVVLARDPDRFLRASPHLAGAPGLVFWPGSMESFKFPEACSHFIHLASETYRNGETPDALQLFLRNVDGTRHVLEFARHCEARSFLFSSSGAVYGPQPPELSYISETFTGSPPPENIRYAYGHSKRAGEALCCLYHESHGLPVKIARCFAFVGPYLPLGATYAIGNFIRDARGGGSIQVQGDGTPRRSYLYAADLAIWLWTILLDGQVARPYNVGSDQDLSILDLARKVAGCLRPGAAISVAPAPAAGDLPERYVPDIHRAKDELGLHVQTSLDDAILKTASWYGAKERGMP